MKTYLIIAACGLLASHVTHAATLLTVGDTLPDLTTLTTQHEKPATEAKSVARIIFSNEKQTANMATDFFDDQRADYLTKTHSLYVADIHRMPSLVSKWIALPQLREKPYDIVLGRDEKDLNMFPHQSGCLTLMAVRAQKVQSIDFACSGEALKKMLTP